jgi:acetolactate synthase-1/2/3 large subunit
MSLTGGQALVAQLRREGVKHVFGIPGVQLDWAVEALRQARAEISYLVPRHEQSTAYMADGYARTTGREGVCMVVPGPGVLNALSGLATAFACNARVLFIAGQIPSPALGCGLGLLHEIPDQSGILRSLTKWHGLARSADEIPALINQAFHELRSGRPRPVAVELPPDVLQATTDAPPLEPAVARASRPDPTLIAQAVEWLRAARSPVIQAGGGAAAADAGGALTVLAERLQAPVVMTEGARGVLPDRHPLALGTLGGRAVFPHADLVLVVGSRFLDGQGAATHSGPGCRFIYVNLDPSHTGAPRSGGIRIVADARATLDSLVTALGETRATLSRAAEIDKVKRWCARQFDRLEPQASFVRALRESLPEDGILVSELTQVGYFANVAFPVQRARSYVTPGYQGTLGYGLPTALGAATGNPDRRVISITGDGGFGWNMQELGTAVRYGLDVRVVVFADGRYGNVQRIQRRLFGEEFATDLANPDFGMLAAAFRIPHRRADSPQALADALSELSSHRGPALIEVRVGEMPSPWALIHPFVPSPVEVPPNPLGEPGR